MLAQIAAHSNSYHGHGLEEALEGIAKAGYHSVELSAVPGWTEQVRLSDDPAVIRRTVEATGLHAIAIGIHSNLTTDEGLDYALKGVQWASDYGLPLVTTQAGERGTYQDPEYEFLSRIQALASTAERLEVTVALETHGDLMPTGETARQLIERVESPSIKVKYDTANVEFYGGVRAVDDIHHILEHTVSLDIKDHIGGEGDWNFPPPGDGHIDFRSVLSILAQVQFSGPLAIEIEFHDRQWPELHLITEAMTEGRKHIASLCEEFV